MVPIDSTLHRVCGHRYQEGGAGGPNPPTCTCGMFAVGRCTECDAPVCGHPGCSEHAGLLLLCRTHADRRRRAHGAEQSRYAAGARVIAEERRGATLQSLWQSWLEQRKRLIHVLSKIPDPTERLLGALNHCTVKPQRGMPDGCVDRSLLAESFGELWSSADEVDLLAESQPWDSGIIARWFARRALGANLPYIRSGYGVWYPQRIGVGFGKRPRKGWWAGTSTRPPFLSTKYDAAPYHFPIFVERDGQRWTHSLQTFKGERILDFEGERGGEFSGSSLVEMAQRFGLDDPSVRLPPPPRPPIDPTGPGLIF